MAQIRRRGGGKVDWERIRNTTDEEIDAMIASDPDTAPEMFLDWRKVITAYVPDVRALRRKLGLSQTQFASKFGFSVSALQEWSGDERFPTAKHVSSSESSKSRPRPSNVPSPPVR